MRIALPCIVATAAMMATTPAMAATHPGRLADQVGGDPKSQTPECRAAQADARAWDEERGVSAMKGVARIVIWPLGERAARRRGEAKNQARELVMQTVREACFTQPSYVRAAPVSGQRWPGAKGYDKAGGLDIVVGGREIAALVHPKFNTIWARSRGGGPGYPYWNDDEIVRSVAWSIEPAGCAVTQDRPGPDFSREVAFSCPEGVNLRALVEAKSALIRRGAWPNPAD